MCWACGPRARGGPGRSSLPRSADNEGEEGEDQDDDDDEAAAVGAAAVDTALPLIVEFAVGAHGGKRKTRRAAGFGLLARGRLAIVDAFLFRGL